MNSRSDTDPALRALEPCEEAITMPGWCAAHQAWFHPRLAAAEAAPLDVEGLMHREHLWCVQVEGEWALGHEVEAHRKQAEFILAATSREGE